MLDFGEDCLCTGRLSPADHNSPTGIELAKMKPGYRGQPKDLVLNYLTPHSKWSIHSTYSDTLTMLTLFRGGEAIWINNEDARNWKSKTMTGWSASTSTV